MGVETKVKIKGYVKYEDILQFVKEKYDVDATARIGKEVICPVSKLEFDHSLNESSEDSENWYIISGGIYFNYGEEYRGLAYFYSNVNGFENLEHYSKKGLKGMVMSETTTLSLSYWGSSVQIMKDLIQEFGPGWIDEDDSDEEEYYLLSID